MTLIGIKFEDPKTPIRFFANMIKSNSEKPFVKVTFNVKVYCVEHDVMIINKVFVPAKAINTVYYFLLIGSLVPLIIWNTVIPAMIIWLLYMLWMIFNSSVFNFLLFKIMIKKSGYTGKLRQL